MCLDGEERGFLLSHKIIRALSKTGKIAVGSTSMAEFISVGLHAALQGPEMTEDELDEVLPADNELLTEFWAALVKHCSGGQANDKYRPTTARNGTGQTGSNSPRSGESNSASQSTSSGQ